MVSSASSYYIMTKDFDSTPWTSNNIQTAQLLYAERAKSVDVFMGMVHSFRDEEGNTRKPSKKRRDRFLLDDFGSPHRFSFKYLYKSEAFTSNIEIVSTSEDRKTNNICAIFDTPMFTVLKVPDPATAFLELREDYSNIFGFSTSAWTEEQFKTNGFIRISKELFRYLNALPCPYNLDQSTGHLVEYPDVKYDGMEQLIEFLEQQLAEKRRLELPTPKSDTGHQVLKWNVKPIR